MGSLVALKGCKAGNPQCGLKTGSSALLGPIGAVHCDVCCAEPGFCPECRCVLCSGAIAFETGGVNDWIQCLETIGGGIGVCGHSVHLECALKCRMAGVVAGSGLDVEYLCRRCDKKMDLLPHASQLIEGVAAAPTKAIAERSVKLALRLVEGTLRTGVRALEKLIRDLVQKAEKGGEIQSILKELCNGGTAAALQATSKELSIREPLKTTSNGHCDVKSLQHDTQATTAEAMEIDGCAALALDGQDDPRPVHAMRSNEDENRIDSIAGTSAALVVASKAEEDRQADVGQVQTRKEATEGLGPPFESLALQYRQEIENTLQNLKRAQEQEYEAAKERLSAQMERILNQYQLLETGVAKHSSSSVALEAFDSFMDKTLNQLANLKREREKFESMLQIGQGFGAVSKDLLHNAFQWPPDRTTRR